MSVEINEVESPDSGRRAFVVGAAAAGAAVLAGAGAAAAAPSLTAGPGLQTGGRVSVYVPPEAFGKLDVMFGITKDILGRLGCLACHSGILIDWRLIQERNFVVDPRSLKINETRLMLER